MATAKEALKDMFLNVNDDTDVTFMVHGTEFKAHKCVLHARAHFLRYVLSKPPTNGLHYQINNPKIDVKAFGEFLKFLYLGECEINFGNLSCLLYLSKLYEAPSLREYSITFSCDACSRIADVIQIGEVGIRHENYCPELLRCVLQQYRRCLTKSFFYVKNDLTIFASKELVGKIAKYCAHIEHFHDFIFFEVFEWAEKKCISEKGVIDAEHIRTNLSGIVDKLNLELISDRDFIDIVQKNGLLPPDQCNQELANRLEKRIKYDDLMRRIRRRN